MDVRLYGKKSSVGDAGSVNTLNHPFQSHFARQLPPSGEASYRFLRFG